MMLMEEAMKLVLLRDFIRGCCANSGRKTQFVVQLSTCGEVCAILYDNHMLRAS